MYFRKSPSSSAVLRHIAHNQASIFSTFHAALQCTKNLLVDVHVLQAEIEGRSFLVFHLEELLLMGQTCAPIVREEPLQIRMRPVDRACYPNL